jgi:ubiquinone/menaquinone biosynthesis C-methylase UbiE
VRRYKWRVDNEVNEICWTDMRRDALNVLGQHPVKVVDLGGGSGGFSNVIYRRNQSNLVISIDMDYRALRNAGDGINPVRADVQMIPLKNGSIDGVLGRAILHHIPDDIERIILEINRVLKYGGHMVIQEPCEGNIFAKVARELFITEIHEEGEKPLDQEILIKTISKYFEIEKIDHHFFFSYLMPHIAARLRSMRRLMVSLTRFLMGIDKGLMRQEFFKRRAAYLSITAVKNSGDGKPNG